MSDNDNSNDKNSGLNSDNSNGGIKRDGSGRFLPGSPKPPNSGATKGERKVSVQDATAILAKLNHNPIKELVALAKSEATSNRDKKEINVYLSDLIHPKLKAKEYVAVETDDDDDEDGESDVKDLRNMNRADLVKLAKGQ